MDFNLFALRRVYNPGGRGRGDAGRVRRQDIKFTLTFKTLQALYNAVPTGRGKYGSALVELAVRSMLALTGSLPINQVGEELVLCTTDRVELVQNLRALADYVETYKPDEHLQFAEAPLVDVHAS